MRMRTLCWLAVPLLAGLLAYFAAKGELIPAWSAVVRRAPRIDYPRRLDLGPQEIGEHAAARFTIANRGAGELVLDQIQTNCSCSGMEREEQGRFVRLESLRLKAGEQADLVMRVSVRGVPIGAEMINVVEFRTNDPAEPAGRMEVVARCVSGSVSVTPPSVVFGTVATGAKVRQVVDVRDKSITPRHIERVVSTVPDRVRVRLLPSGDESHRTEPHPDGELIGQIEVVVETESPGEVNATFHIHLAGETRRPDAVPVFGRVAPPIEMSPSLLVLPRASSNGPVYSATCLCRSNSGEPLSLTVDSLPPGTDGRRSGPG
jgi:hypothetical protein